MFAALLQKPNTLNMNTKNIFALLIAAVITCSAFASGDSTKVRKNEIGLNVAPVLTVLMGGSLYTTRYGMTYKKMYNEKRNFRFGISYDETFDNSSMPQPYLSEYENDTTRVDYYGYFKSNYKWRFAVGYECVWGKKKLKQFAGADIIGGFYRTYSNSYENVMHVDTILPPATNAGTYETLIEVRDVATHNSTTKFIGLSPFYGIKYPLGNRWEVSAQIGYDMSFGISKGTSTFNGQQTNATVYTFDLNTPGLINDVSLIYRF